MVDAATIQNERMYPSETEVGMYNPISDVGVHLRDDGCLELYAGRTSIVLDGSTGAITIEGSRINNVAKQINNRTDPNSFNLPRGAIDPYWFPSTTEEIAAYTGMSDASLKFLEFSRSVLQPTNIASYNTPMLLTGAPAPGQSLIALSEITKTRPICRRTRRDASVLRQIERALNQLEN